MAGLLTFPQSALPSQPCHRPVTFSKQTLCLRGLQLQVQFQTFTGFPCIEMAPSHPITIIYARKGTAFPLNYQPNLEKLQNRMAPHSGIRYCKIQNDHISCW